MLSIVVCPKCSTRLQVPDGHTGPVSCPKCKADQFARQVLAAFSGSLPPRPPTLMYRLGIVLVGICMVVLPLVYVGMVGGVAWALFKHLTQWGPAILAEAGHTSSGRGAVWMFLLGYLGPLLSGGVILIFMVKPLFAERTSFSLPKVLDPAQQPLLFAFVQRLCEIVGAPRPTRIQLTCDVNAAAGIDGGLRGLFGKRITLSIGAPLIAGLTLRQFAGVLAHEFGHFRQGGGMRMTYVIRFTNHWFSQVVFQRDAWDEALVTWRNSMPVRELAFLFLFIELCVWLTRRILWALMHVGHAISCFMLRQMEFDADFCEFSVAGSETFVATTRRLRLLEASWRKSIHDLEGALNDGQLADNACQLLLSNFKQIPKEVVSGIEKQQDEQRTRWFETHPSDKDRMAQALAAGTPGVFRIDGSAAPLFNNFAQLSRDVTQLFYKQALRGGLEGRKLVPTQRLIKQHHTHEESTQVRDEYFAGAYNALRPLGLSAWTEEKLPTVSAAREALVKLRAAIAARAPQYQEASAEYAACVDRWLKADVAEALGRARLNFNPAQYELSAATWEEAQMASRAATEGLRELDEKLVPLEKLVRQRARLALAMSRSPELALKLPDAQALAATVSRLRPVTDDLARIWMASLRLRNARVALDVLVKNFKPGASTAKHQDALRRYMARVHSCLEDVRNTLPGEYPFEHAVAGISLAQYLLPQMPRPDNWQGIFEGADALLSRLNHLANRLACELAAIAVSVERAIDEVGGPSRGPTPKEEIFVATVVDEHAQAPPKSLGTLGTN